MSSTYVWCTWSHNIRSRCPRTWTEGITNYKALSSAWTTLILCLTRLCWTILESVMINDRIWFKFIWIFDNFYSSVRRVQEAVDSSGTLLYLWKIWYGLTGSTSTPLLAKINSCFPFFGKLYCWYPSAISQVKINKFSYKSNWIVLYYCMSLSY